MILQCTVAVFLVEVDGKEEVDIMAMELVLVDMEDMDHNKVDMEEATLGTLVAAVEEVMVEGTAAQNHLVHDHLEDVMESLRRRRAAIVIVDEVSLCSHLSVDSDKYCRGGSVFNKIVLFALVSVFLLSGQLRRGCAYLGAGGRGGGGQGVGLSCQHASRLPISHFQQLTSFSNPPKSPAVNCPP